jgi:Cu2+-exporting ATPase
MVAVLVITCPHALGLAIPLVASISTTKAAKNGFLVKQRLALESARTIDTVLFDKTGTLTKGSFSVTAIQADEGYTEGQVLRLAAAVNAYSEHPLAGAITDEAKVRNITYGPATEFRRIPGKGVSATVDGEMVMVGSQVLADEYSAGIGRALGTEAKRLEHEGATLNFVMRGSQVIGFVALADTIREESREAIRTLRAMGIETAMITGDAEDVARWVAGELGIDTYFARVLPGEKAGKVKALQADGRRVAMVGDGVNDAPALAQADVGIAIGAGTNVAIESAGIILVRNDPQDIPKIITLSRLTYRKMIQNLFWATGYNVIAIPLAAGVLAYRGILLNPAVAAFLMSVSTVIVAANALLLRRASLESSG